MFTCTVWSTQSLGDSSKNDKLQLLHDAPNTVSGFLRTVCYWNDTEIFEGNDTVTPSRQIRQA